MCNALKWARERHVPFRLRSGRHSYENFSLLNRGLIIDVSEMHRITVNTDKLTATIESGANLGTVYKELWNYGVTIPAGTSASVGIVGLALGGGIGMLSRLFGLTCDQIEVEMVQACCKFGAKIIRANEHENHNLFWACHGGGGGNFGIITFNFSRTPYKMYQSSPLHGNGKILSSHFKLGKTGRLIQTNVSLHQLNYSQSNKTKLKHKVSLLALPLNSIPYYLLFLKLVPLSLYR